MVFSGEDLGRGKGRVRLGGWPPHLDEQNITKFEKGCEYYGRSKGKLSRRVPHFDFYFVASLVFLVKQFSIRFQFSNRNILGTFRIGSASPRYLDSCIQYMYLPLILHYRPAL